MSTLATGTEGVEHSGGYQHRTLGKNTADNSLPKL